MSQQPDLKAEFERLKEKVRVEVDSMSQREREYQGHIARLQADLVRAAREKTELARECQEAKIHAETLEAAVRQMRANLDELREESTQSRHLREDLIRQLSESQGTLMDQRDDAQHFRTQAQHAQQQLTEAQSRISQLKEECQKSQHLVMSLQNHLAEAQTTAEQMRAHREEWRAQEATLHRMLAEAQTEASSWKDKAAEAQRSPNPPALQVEAASPSPPPAREVESLEQLYHQAQAQISVLKAQLRAEEARYARQLSENSQNKAQVQLLQQQLTAEQERAAQPAHGPPPSAGPAPVATDYGTGLPSFQVARARLANALKGAVALAAIDMDGLRHVNQVFGRDVGDLVMREWVSRLQGFLKPDDLLTRGQDDELWVLMTNPNAGNAAIQQITHKAYAALAKFIDSLSAPFSVEEHKLQASVGCGLVGSSGPESADSLVERALLALHGSKQLGRNRILLYQQETHRSPEAEAPLLPQLQAALKAGQFCLRFQPIYDLHLRQIWGAQSSMRWNHPTLGFLEAPAFYGEAMGSSFALQLGEWSLKEACRIGKSLNLRVSSPVSAMEMMQADFVRKLLRVLETSRFPRPDLLMLEISEKAVSPDNERLALTIKELRRWNVGVAIDDLSLESLSLGQLQKLNPTYLKLAPSLVKQIDTLKGKTLVRSALAVAEHLAGQVIATGIEIVGQLDALVELGCTLGQGDLLGATVPPGNLKEMESWRLERPKPPPPQAFKPKPGQRRSR